MRFTILVAFKNRDEVRARNFFDSLEWQTFKDFEVILINQGSDEEYNGWVEALPLHYPFLKCIHTCTSGYLWNKANALNIGIKEAQGDYVVVGDIDLVFRPDYLEEINKHLKPGVFITHNVYYLPESFLLKTISDLSSAKYNERFREAFHSACVIEREILLTIKGYDEFYLVWGVEDDDIIRSLVNVNQFRLHFSAVDINIYHQWHPSVSPGNPRPWYLVMVDHLFSVSRDKDFGIDWGKKLLPEDRPVLSLLNDKNYLQTNKLDFWKEETLFFFNTFIDGFYNLKAGEQGFLEFPFIMPPAQKKATWFPKKTSHSNNVVEQITNKDISQFFHFFIGCRRHLLKDYFYTEENNTFLFVFIKK